jgi:allantoin racemase
LRICYLIVNPEDVSGPLVELLDKLFNSIIDPGTEIGFKFPKVACNRAMDFEHSYFLLLNKVEVIKAVIEAEIEGYDAVVVSCYLDTGVQEAREMVDIPVVGINEASLILASQMGKKVAVVGLNEPKMNIQTDQVIKGYTLSTYCINDPVIPLEMTSREWMTVGMKDHEIVIEPVEKAAKIGISRGADVIIVGCGGLGPLCSLVGLKEVTGTNVPVLDPVTIGIKTAESRVRIIRKLQLPAVSRGGKYKKPRDKDFKRIIGIFNI